MPTDLYPDSEYPWNFYFNGVLMPKWGACWPSCFIKPEEDWDQDIGHRDIYLIWCRIDHVGVTESAEAAVFIYAVQEMLCLLLERREEALKHIASWCNHSADEVYAGVIDAAIQMRTLARDKHMAFWTTGYEPDCLRLIEDMQRSQLPPTDNRFKPAPHVHDYARSLELVTENQTKKLHALAQSVVPEKEWRKALHSI